MTESRCSPEEGLRKCIFAVAHCFTGAEVPMPYAASLEQAALPQVEDVIKATRKTVNK